MQARAGFLPVEITPHLGKSFPLNRNFYVPFGFAGWTGGSIKLPLAPALAEPARHHDPKQERHKQALQRRLPGNGAKSGDRLSWPFCILDRLAQAVDGNLQRSGDLFDRARHLSCSIDRAFRNAGGWYLRCVGVHARRLPCEGKGPPPLAIRASACFSNSGSQTTFGYPRQAP
jgi:hypothetical protein